MAREEPPAQPHPSPTEGLRGHSAPVQARLQHPTPPSRLPPWAVGWSSWRGRCSRSICLLLAPPCVLSPPGPT
jgi:hypothetical protein